MMAFVYMYMIFTYMDKYNHANLKPIDKLNAVKFGYVICMYVRSFMISFLFIPFPFPFFFWEEERRGEERKGKVRGEGKGGGR